METWELNEQKKEYLNGYKYARRREKMILDEIQQLRLDTMFPCLQGDGMPRGSRQSDLSDYMARREDLIEELKAERLEMVTRMQEIRAAIRKLRNEDEKEVLERRYILLCEWEEIAEELNYSRRYILKIHGRALKNFEIPESGH